MSNAGAAGLAGGAGAGGEEPDAGVPQPDRYSFQRSPVDPAAVSRPVPVFHVAASDGLTRNDPPGELLTPASLATAKGSAVQLFADGSFTYTPPSAGFWGDDGFEYSVGALSVSVSISVQPEAIELNDLEREEGNGFLIGDTEADDFAGSFVANAGDVNGDGLSDFMVAAPNANGSGIVYVVFGKADHSTVQLRDIGGPGPATGFSINGVALDDFTGRQLAAAGDVNGDGLADLLVGTAEGDRMPGDGTGIAYVVFGKRDNVSVNLADLQQENAGLGFAIFGFDEGDSAGRSVAGAGDFNGDKLDDLLIGALSADDRNGGENAGAAYVVFGKKDTKPVELRALEQAVDSDQGVFFAPIAPQDFTGAGVAGADINGDGLGDVLISASDGDLGGSDAGQVYVIFGSRDPHSLVLDAIDGGFTIIGNVSGDAFGRNLANAGDVNGDGLADIIIGAGGFDADDATDDISATVYVIFGKKDEANVSLSALSPAQGFRISGVALSSSVPGQGHFTGSPVAGAGDLNGDGFSDLVVGAYGASFPGRQKAGAAHVILGGPSLTSLDVSELDGAPGSHGFSIRGRRSFDGAGFSVAGGGDIDGDGLADLIVGNPGVQENVDAPGPAAYVLFGWNIQGARRVPPAAPAQSWHSAPAAPPGH